MSSTTAQWLCCVGVVPQGGQPGGGMHRGTKDADGFEAACAGDALGRVGVVHGPITARDCTHQGALGVCMAQGAFICCGGPGRGTQKTEAEPFLFLPAIRPSSVVVGPGTGGLRRHISEVQAGRCMAKEHIRHDAPAPRPPPPPHTHTSEDGWGMQGGGYQRWLWLWLWVEWRLLVTALHLPLFMCALHVLLIPFGCFVAELCAIIIECFHCSAGLGQRVPTQVPATQHLVAFLRCSNL